LVEQCVLILHIIELDTIRPNEPIKRRDREKFDVITKMLPACRENFFEALGRGDHCWASVKRKSCISVDVGSSAGLIASFKQRGPQTQSLQAACGCQATKPTPDYCRTSFSHNSTPS
jgi:hypothetical protein